MCIRDRYIYLPKNGQRKKAKAFSQPRRSIRIRHNKCAIRTDGAPQTVKKASQSLRPQAQIKFQAFFPAACTSAKTLLGSQTCERKRVRCGEPQPFPTRAQRSGSRWRACQRTPVFAKRKPGGFFTVGGQAASFHARQSSSISFTACGTHAGRPSVKHSRPIFSNSSQ